MANCITLELEERRYQFSTLISIYMYKDARGTIQVYHKCRA